MSVKDMCNLVSSSLMPALPVSSTNWRTRSIALLTTASSINCDANEWVLSISCNVMNYSVEIFTRSNSKYYAKVTIIAFCDEFSWSFVLIIEIFPYFCTHKITIKNKLLW